MPAIPAQNHQTKREIRERCGGSTTAETPSKLTSKRSNLPDRARDAHREDAEPPGQGLAPD
jgi:hypothetical protein